MLYAFFFCILELCANKAKYLAHLAVTAVLDNLVALQKHTHTHALLGNFRLNNRNIKKYNC